MLYGVAAIMGPIGASSVMQAFGYQSLFYWVGAVYVSLALFSLYRLTRRGPPDTKEPYVPVPRTSPAVFELDPRAEVVEVEEGRSQ